MTTEAAAAQKAATTNTEASGTRSSRELEGHTGGSQDPPVALAVEDVVTAEGSATQVQADQSQASTVQSWLCTPKAAPRRVELAAIPELVADDDNFVWVDITNYTIEDLQEVERTLHLHAMAVHAALSPWKRPGLDVFSDQFFVSATIPELDLRAYRIHARELDVFVGHNYLVSAHKATLPFGDHVLARAEQNPQLLDRDSAFMLYIFLDELLAYYEGLYEQLQDAVETLEVRALGNTSEDYLKELQRFKRFAYAAGQLATQHRQIFTAFLRPDFHWVTGEGVEVYFRDLDARFASLSEALITIKEAANSAFDIYVSHIAHRTNQVMKLLTIVSTILLPTSVIFGFFGTNNLQTIPFLLQPGGFVLMVLMILTISIGSLVIFSRRGWLK